jgi:hypothetical protein
VSPLFAPFAAMVLSPAVYIVGTARVCKAPGNADAPSARKAVVISLMAI